MATIILLAIVGNHTFPGHEGWWVAYVIICLFGRFMSIKELDEIKKAIYVNK